MSTETHAGELPLLAGPFAVVDLTHAIHAGIPSFDNDPNAFVYEKFCSVEDSGCFAGAFRIAEHFGTHIDAPAHFVGGAPTIEKIPASKLVLPAVVIDVRREVQANCDYALTLERIESFERDGAIAAQSAVLLLTGWDQRFASAQRYRNDDENQRMHFPGYSLEAARFLVEKRRSAALGIDTLSIDVGVADDYCVHREALASAYFIENLTNLHLLPARGAIIFCGALPIEGGSGCPSRILAVVPKEC